MARIAKAALFPQFWAHCADNCGNRAFVEGGGVAALAWARAHALHPLAWRERFRERDASLLPALRSRVRLGEKSYNGAKDAQIARPK